MSHFSQIKGKTKQETKRHIRQRYEKVRPLLSGNFRNSARQHKTTMQNRSVRVLNSGRSGGVWLFPGQGWTMICSEILPQWCEQKQQTQRKKRELPRKRQVARLVTGYGKLCGYLISRLHASVILLMRFFIVSWPFMVRLLCCDLWLFVADATWKKTMTGKKKQMRHLMMNRGFYFIYLSFLRFQQIRH